MEFADDGGVQLHPDDKKKLIKFLESLTDTSFTTNPDYLKL